MTEGRERMRREGRREERKRMSREEGPNAKAGLPVIGPTLRRWLPGISGTDDEAEQPGWPNTTPCIHRQFETHINPHVDELESSNPLLYIWCLRRSINMNSARDSGVVYKVEMAPTDSSCHLG